MTDNVDTITIQDCCLGRTAVRLLADFLEKGAANLTALTLGANDLGEEAVRVLASSLAENRVLHTLSLWSNAIRDQGATFVAAALHTNQALLTLDLSCNGIGNAGAVSLGEALEKNSSLTTLLLWGNRIGKTGIGRLSAGLRKNSTLCSLALWDNSGWSAFAAEIKKLIRRNCLLRKASDRIGVRKRSRGEIEGKRSRPRHAPGAPQDPNWASWDVLAAEVRMEVLACLSLASLFNLAGCASSVREEIFERRDQLERLCRRVSFADFMSRLQASAQEQEQQCVSERTERYGLRARRALASRAQRDTEERLLALLRMPVVRPLVRSLDLRQAPMGFILSDELWEVLQQMEQLSHVEYPRTGWQDITQRRRCMDRLGELVAHRTAISSI